MPVQQRERLRAAVIEAGREGKFAVFNLGGVFDEFIYYSDIPMEWWQRDTSHLNSRGMQLIGRMLALFFDPAVQPAPETETLLLRADYETDPAQAGWSRSEEFTGGWDDTQSYTGLRSMKLALGTYTSPAFPLQPKKAYRVSFAAWARGGGQWSLIAYDKDAKVCYTRELTIPAYHSWTAYEESVTGPADVVTARLRFQPGKSECYLDDVAVQPGARQQPAVAAAGAPAPEATQKTFVEVVGTITRATKPLSYEEITPYTASLRTVEFRIDRVLSGALTAKSIIALQMAMRDKKLLPAVAYTPGMTFRLKLGLWDETDSLDTLPVADDLEMLDATWYYVITCEPARK